MKTLLFPAELEHRRRHFQFCIGFWRRPRASCFIHLQAARDCGPKSNFQIRPFRCEYFCRNDIWANLDLSGIWRRNELACIHGRNNGAHSERGPIWLDSLVDSKLNGLFACEHKEEIFGTIHAGWGLLKISTTGMGIC